MNAIVRVMNLGDTDIITNYFASSSPEHLELLGVDPTRLPSKQASKKFFELEYEKNIEDRTFVAILWENDDVPVGFSTAEKIVYGDQAYMHLHIVNPELRQQGIGANCVRQSVKIYFDLLKIRRLYCEPNAFNIAPNRTLQKAGFKYIKTHQTVPGPLNFHQMVNQWLIE